MLLTIQCILAILEASMHADNNLLEATVFLNKAPLFNNEASVCKLEFIWCLHVHVYGRNVPLPYFEEAW